MKLGCLSLHSLYRWKDILSRSFSSVYNIGYKAICCPCHFKVLAYKQRWMFFLTFFCVWSTTKSEAPVWTTDVIIFTTSTKATNGLRICLELCHLSSYSHTCNEVCFILLFRNAFIAIESKACPRVFFDWNPRIVIPKKY